MFRGIFGIDLEQDVSSDATCECILEGSSSLFQSLMHSCYSRNMENSANYSHSSGIRGELFFLSGLPKLRLENLVDFLRTGGIVGIDSYGNCDSCVFKILKMIGNYFKWITSRWIALRATVL